MTGTWDEMDVRFANVYRFDIRYAMRSVNALQRDLLSFVLVLSCVKSISFAGFFHAVCYVPKQAGPGVDPG